MGYSIYIGEYTIDPIDPRYPDDEPYVHCPEITLPDAPAFLEDEMSAHNNGRHPSYSGWNDFVWDVGLHEFFFHKQYGLMREHAGIFDITKEHLFVVQEALVDYRKKVGDIEPRFGSRYIKNGNLARLIWLEWWMKWALANCKRPAISNS